MASFHSNDDNSVDFIDECEHIEITEKTARFIKKCAKQDRKNKKIKKQQRNAFQNKDNVYEKNRKNYRRINKENCC